MNNLLRKSVGRSPYSLRYLSIQLVFYVLFAIIGSAGIGIFYWSFPSEAWGSDNAFLNSRHPLIRNAVEVHQRHKGDVLNIPDVVGTGVGVGRDGLPVIKVFTKRAKVTGIPQKLESIPLQVEMTGMIVALGDTSARYRPAPIGVSTGHPLITAGTIGARVKDTAGNVYALSNNHVYANSNYAGIGDNVLQPGTIDGGKNPDDTIGILSAFQPIVFGTDSLNYIDAAIARSTTYDLGNSTLPDGYGIPSSEITEPSINMPVQKYGRTTSLTHGIVSAIDVTVEVCYESTGGHCTKSAYFYDQIQIAPPGFSGGGDSGSLIVTDDGYNKPVGLLFAGSDTVTIANRIDRVLNILSGTANVNLTIDNEGGATLTPPAAPNNLVATPASSSQINLTWNDASNNETGFKIERCQGSVCNNFTPIATVAANVISYSDAGLSASTVYSYRIRAFNAGGESGYSNTVSAQTYAANTPPAAPSNLSANAVSKSQINLTWTDNSNNETGFKVERCTGSICSNFKQIATVGANVKTYRNTYLNRNSAYRYRVRAYNKVGNSAYSNAATAKTLR